MERVHSQSNLRELPENLTISMLGYVNDFLLCYCSYLVCRYAYQSKRECPCIYCFEPAPLFLQLFKVQEEIKAVKKRKFSLQQSLKRHQGR